MEAEPADTSFIELIPDAIWLTSYPIQYSGCRFTARTTVIRLSSGDLLIHSPCPIDDNIRRDVDSLGKVGFIVAPGNYHWFNVSAWQKVYTDAGVYICPGLDKKRPELRYDGLLGDEPEPGWAMDLKQVVVRGNRFMNEVAFFHAMSRTLILVDLIENFGDQHRGNWLLYLFFKFVFRMWDNPKPAPEYQMGWSDRSAARESLHRILSWDFDRIVISHGALIESAAKETAQLAWRGILK